MCSYAAGWTFQDRSCSVRFTLVCVAYHALFLVTFPNFLVCCTGWWGSAIHPGHTWGAGIAWWTPRRVLSGWPPLTCSKLGICHHNTEHVYVIPYTQTLPLRIRCLLSVAGLELGVVHELGRLPLHGKRRIRRWWDDLWYCWVSPQIPGSIILLEGTWWYWGNLASLHF